MEKIIKVSGLKKSYGSVRAVKGIDFYVDRGSLFAFLGPNGAGKSTTINMLGTLLEPDEGEVIIDGFTLGKEDEKIRSVIGMVFRTMYWMICLRKENMTIRGSFYHSNKKELRAAVDYAVQSTGVTSYQNQPYGKLSGGQKRRSDIARALVNTPKILFWMNLQQGLIHRLGRMYGKQLSNYVKKNMTIFLTTHYMEEAAKADYVIVIDDGLIAAKGTPAQLRERFSTDHLIMHTDHKDEVADPDRYGQALRVQNDTVIVRLESTMQALPLLEQCRDSIQGPGDRRQYG